MSESSSLTDTLNQQFAGPRWPVVESAALADSHATIAVSVPPALVWFEGHFPSHPVLPGVVQVHWAVEYARRVFGIEQAFQKIENLKFKSVVVPDMELEMRFDHEPDRGLVRFVFGNAETIYSEGRITFS